MKSYSSVSVRRFKSKYPIQLMLAMLPRECSVRPDENENGMFFVGLKADPFSEPTEVGRINFLENILYVEFFDTEMGEMFKDKYYKMYPELQELDKK